MLAGDYFRTASRRLKNGFVRRRTVQAPATGTWQPVNQTSPAAFLESCRGSAELQASGRRC